jgi:adenylate kinase family enzyme
MQRVVVIGCTGSGKTTFARALADALGAGHLELDGLHWGPNWTPAPRDVFRARVEAALADRERWVVDGNYRAGRDLIWPRADAVVWLDYSLPLILARLTRRTFGRGLRRTELWNGNREQLWWHFLPWDKSLYFWALKTHRRHRRDLPETLASPEYAHLAIHRFQHPRMAQDWLAGPSSSGRSPEA